ncbi:MAG: hypothetical protein BWY15_00975 [Firmicutes bacterium ADurb.Bin193]|nr:MAG: hypothetical protein BWY15_00975 [Firmicutes bacterium ADurb.Bin193]
MDVKVVFWIFIAIVMGVVEATSMALVSIWFCVGAVAAAIVATFVPSVFVQSVVFVAVTGILLIFTRPLAKRLMKQEYVPTNADRIIGSDGLVTETIDPIEGTGKVKISGQIWSARSEDSAKIDEGTMVKIIKISGAHAVVRSREEQ